MVPLAAMSVTATASLVMAGVCMIRPVVAIPAVVVTPVPAVVPSGITSVLPAMLPVVFARMTNITIVTGRAPLMTSITIVERDERSTDVDCKTNVLMLSVRWQRKCSGERHNYTDLDQELLHGLLNIAKEVRNIGLVH